MTGKCPFEIVYGNVSITPLELIPQLPQNNYNIEGEQWGAKIKQLHVQVKEMTEKQNLKYQHQANKHQKAAHLKEGDLVWIRLRKERFPHGSFGKLKPCADGPFRITKNINDNAFQIDLPGDTNISPPSMWPI